MPASRLHNSIRRLVFMVGLLIPVILSMGCATSTVTASSADPEVETETPSVPNNWLPVARYGRYTLVELAPQAAQQNLLLQTVNVSIPSTPTPSVGEGLRQVLQRSGYSLCDDDQVSEPLYSLPLPAAHLQLGPMFLHDALVTLAGPAWELQVDHRARQVCFTPGQETAP